MINIKNCMLFLILLLSSQAVFAVSFGLFGDISLNQSDIKDKYTGFTLGDLDFFATKEISDDTRAFVELVFENSSSGIVTDLERFWIMRTFKDEFKVAAGRFHSPLGRWNRTYHHGSLIQDTVSRPFFLDFEDGSSGVLPVHFVGMMFSGDFIGKTDELNYELAIGNGPSLDSSGGLAPTTSPEIEVNGSSDTNSNKTVALRVIYGQDNLPLQVGVFAMTHDVGESNATTGLVSKGATLVNQTIYGTDFLYTSNPFEVLFEYYQFMNKNNVGITGTRSATAWFAQITYTIFDDFKAIVREESLSFDKNKDSYFRMLGTEQAKHHVFGLRYDLDELNAIKMELDIADNNTSKDTTKFTLQWAFLIP